MQHHKKYWITMLLLIFVAPMLVACGSIETAAEEVEAPAIVEDIDGSDFHRITLHERAAERLGVQTSPVEEQESDGSVFAVVPDSAVLYDVNGATWVYVKVDELVFMRVSVDIHEILDGNAFLAEGPGPGSEVVTVGAAELYGIDLGVGK